MAVNIMGAGGQLGRKVLQALLDQGARPGDIVASAHSPSKIDDFSRRGINVKEADYDDPASLTEAFAGSEVLLLIPSIAPVEHRVRQHGNAVEAAAAAGVKRVLFASLATAIPTSRFSVSPFFLYAEAKLRLSGLDWTILRNNMYLDPVADWIPELVEMGRLPYPVKSGRVAYVCRDDLARAVAAACLNSGHSNKIYELTGPEALSMPRLAEIISRAAGAPVRFDSISEDEYAEICRQGNEEVPEVLIQMLITLYRAVDNNEFANATDHVESLTGRPAERAEDFIPRVIRK